MTCNLDMTAYYSLLTTCNKHTMIIYYTMSLVYLQHLTCKLQLVNCKQPYSVHYINQGNKLTIERKFVLEKYLLRKVEIIKSKFFFSEYIDRIFVPW